MRGIGFKVRAWGWFADKWPTFYAAAKRCRSRSVHFQPSVYIITHDALTCGPVFSAAGMTLGHARNICESTQIAPNTWFLAKRALLNTIDSHDGCLSS